MPLELKDCLLNLTGAPPENQRFLLAVSGGLDSVVLTRVFSEYALDFGIAHCNFQLRGREADEDETFVAFLAKTADRPFFSHRFATRSHAGEAGISIQMAARELRYTWLEQIRSSNGFDWIVTAHHLDDALETFFINFLRGSGLRGLAGIPAKNGRILRPFYRLSRAELEVYYREKHLMHREDASNAETYYLRNKIRHLLIPVLRQIEPGLLKKSADNFDALQSSLEVYDFALENIRKSALSQEGQRQVLDWRVLESCPAPESIAFELLSPFGFNADQCRLAWSIRKGQPGKTFLSDRFILLVDRNRFILEPQTSDATSFSIAVDAGAAEIAFPEGRLIFQRHKANPTARNANRDNLIALLSTEALSYPLLVRKWRPGDRFCPSGMEGRHKKIQDLLTDAGMDRLRKQRVWVLENGDGNILWVIGVRQDHRFTLSPASADSYLQIQLIPRENA